MAAEEPPRLPPLYRVEVIVFTHEQGRSDAFLTEELRGFDDLIDPLELAEAERRAIQAAEEFARMYPADPPLERRESETPALPKPFLAVAQLSDSMSRALRRLNDSPAYRPVSWRVWYQPAERGIRTPRIRFHDQEVIREGWPEEAAAQASIRVAGDSVDREDSNEAEIRPEYFYRLDGSVRLHQRQFLHLDIDLEWRDPVGRFGPGGYTPDPAEAEPRSWSLHRLSDSRVVRAGRLEYFDSAWLGVVVFLERFEQPVIEPEPEPEPESEPQMDADERG